MARIALPRDVASAVIVRGFASAQRAIVVIGALLSAIAITITVLERSGDPAALAIAVAAIVGIAVLALWLLLRPTATSVALFLAAGAALSAVHVVALVSADPAIAGPGPYLLNRPATALIMVGALGGSARSGLVLSAAGLVAGQASLAAGFALAGRPPDFGLTPFLAFLIVAIAYVALELSGRRARRRVPDLRALRAEVAIADRQRELEHRAARVVHDTLLADLAIIAARPGPLDDGARARLERDLAAVEVGSTALADSRPGRVARARVATELLDLVGEYQWSGVRVDVSGCDELELELDDAVRAAVVGATRAALDNVVRHAGAERAEVVVGARDGTLSVLVVDDGVGFAPAEIDTDRLGVRSSIAARVQEAGGSVRVWSGDEGTTVMLSVPAAGASGAGGRGSTS